MFLFWKRTARVRHWETRSRFPFFLHFFEVKAVDDMGRSEFPQHVEYLPLQVGAVVRTLCGI